MAQINLRLVRKILIVVLSYSAQEIYLKVVWLLEDALEQEFLQKVLTVKKSLKLTLSISKASQQPEHPLTSKLFVIVV